MSTVYIRALRAGAFLQRVIKHSRYHQGECVDRRGRDSIGIWKDTASIYSELSAKSKNWARFGKSFFRRCWAQAQLVRRLGSTR